MTVSSITGVRQAPWLRSVARGSMVSALVGITAPGRAGVLAAHLAIAMVTATPLLRVVWVTYRLAREGDRRFVTVGIALLGTVGLGVTTSILLSG